MLGIVFVLPEIIFLLSFGSPPEGRVRHIDVYFHTLIYIVAFYVNYFLLIDKLLFRKKVFVYIIVALLFVAVMVLVGQGVHGIVDRLTGFDRPRPAPRGNGFFTLGIMMREYVMIILTTALSVALKLGFRWAKIEKMKERVAAEQREMELHNLKNQLNPHFLFNTLNNIYALTAIDPEKAQNAIHRLSKLLRYTLYENEEKEVTLDKELLFMQNYIELMKLRLSENSTLEVEIYDGPTRGLTIAPLMFISLVENAFKHGMSGSRPSFIRIRIALDGDTVSCHVENSLFPKKETDKSGSGIGLSNLTKQLSMLYEGRFYYNAIAIGDRYVAELSINLSKSEQ